MRIVFVNSARGRGGGWTSAAELGLGLVEKGHEVTLACHPNSAIAQELQGTRELRLAPIAIRAELNPYRVLQLASLFRRVSPDLLVADKRKDLKLSVAGRQLAGGFPIVHRHGAPSPLKDSAVYRYVWGRKVQTLVLNSRVMRDRMLEEVPWLRRLAIHVIHNGKDPNQYRPRQELRAKMRSELGIPTDAFVASFHGMASPRKRVDLLVQAVAHLPRDLRALGLIVGGGPGLPEVRQLAGELEAPVVFAGIRRDIPEVLAAADVAVHLSTAEGFSNSVLEAMACALPLVVSDATSHPEQVVDGIHGVLVPPDEWRPVADAIRRLAARPEERERMGRAARDRVVTEFSRERMVERYDQVLCETVEAYRTGGRTSS